jgi:hypothetical protein
MEGGPNDCDTTKTFENGSAISADRAEQLKNKYEINDNAAPALNGGTSKTPSSFLNSVRSKMNGDATGAVGSQPSECGKTSNTASPLCNGLKKTTSSSSDRRMMMNGGHEESQIKTTQTNKGKCLLAMFSHSEMVRSIAVVANFTA